MLGREGATGSCRRAGGRALAVTTQEALFWSFRGAPGPRSLSHPENEISKDLLPGRPRCVGGHRAGVERYGESGDGIRGSMSSRRNGDDVAAAGGWQYIFGPSSERVDKIPAAATNTELRGPGHLRVLRPGPAHVRGRSRYGLHGVFSTPNTADTQEARRSRGARPGLRSGPYVCTIQSGRIVCMYVSFWHLCAAQLYVCMYNQKLVCIGMSLLLNIFGFNRSVWQRQFSSYSSNYENTFSNRNRSVW